MPKTIITYSVPNVATLHILTKYNIFDIIVLMTHPIEVGQPLVEQEPAAPDVAAFVQALEGRLVPRSVEEADRIIDGVRRLDAVLQRGRAGGEAKMLAIDEDSIDDLHTIAEKGTAYWQLTEAEKAAYRALIKANSIRDLSPKEESWLRNSFADEPNKEGAFWTFKKEAKARLNLDAALQTRAAKASAEPPEESRKKAVGEDAASSSKQSVVSPQPPKLAGVSSENAEEPKANRSHRTASRPRGPATSASEPPKPAVPKPAAAPAKPAKVAGPSHKRDGIVDLLEGGLDAHGRAHYAHGVEVQRDADGNVLFDTDGKPITRKIGGRFMTKQELDLIEAHQGKIRDGLGQLAIDKAAGAKPDADADVLAALGMTQEEYDNASDKEISERLRKAREAEDAAIKAATAAKAAAIAAAAAAATTSATTATPAPATPAMVSPPPRPSRWQRIKEAPQRWVVGTKEAILRHKAGTVLGVLAVGAAVGIYFLTKDHGTAHEVVGQVPSTGGGTSHDTAQSTITVGGQSTGVSAEAPATNTDLTQDNSFNGHGGAKVSGATQPGLTVDNPFGGKSGGTGAPATHPDLTQNPFDGKSGDAANPATHPGLTQNEFDGQAGGGSGAQSGAVHNVNASLTHSGDTVWNEVKSNLHSLGLPSDDWSVDFVKDRVLPYNHLTEAAARNMDVGAHFTIPREILEELLKAKK
jgi:hypothetical protein